MADAPIWGEQKAFPGYAFLKVTQHHEIVRRPARVFDVPVASTFLAFDGPFTSDAARDLVERQRLAALGRVLPLRLRDVFRERLGGTYSVGVQTETYAEPAEHHCIEFAFDAAPERMDAIQDAFFAVLDSVRASGATPDELRKVAAITRQTHEVAMHDNQYWLSGLELCDRLKTPFSQLVAPQIQSFTPADIRVAAREYLPAQSFIHFTLLLTDSSYMTKDKHQTLTTRTPARRGVRPLSKNQSIRVWYYRAHAGCDRGWIEPGPGTLVLRDVRLLDTGLPHSLVGSGGGSKHRPLENAHRPMLFGLLAGDLAAGGG